MVTWSSFTLALWVMMFPTLPTVPISWQWCQWDLTLGSCLRFWEQCSGVLVLQSVFRNVQFFSNLCLSLQSFLHQSISNAFRKSRCKAKHDNARGLINYNLLASPWLWCLLILSLLSLRPAWVKMILRVRVARSVGSLEGSAKQSCCRIYSLMNSRLSAVSGKITVQVQSNITTWFKRRRDMAWISAQRGRGENCLVFRAEGLWFRI